MNVPGGGALRVAIVGSGPAGFYAAEHLLSRAEPDVEVDMFERLPTPFGLVRFGVAPDHEKIKNVTKTFEKKTASRPGFRFFGNVDIGADVTLDDLRECYHMVCYASGASSDRHMGIPGEDLSRSHPATEFVAWYNGHPDYVDHEFDLSVESVAVVGVGNVAVDVARILCRTPEELATTDIADYALEALQNSRVKEVYMLGRRGPTQAAFTNPEVRELGQMPGANINVLEEEATLDALSQEALDASNDRGTKKKLEIIQSFVGATGDDSKPKTLTIRFLVSPVEITDVNGGVAGMKLVKNELYRADNGTLRPRATDRFEELPVDLVFRSVGYHGLPIANLPFDQRKGVVPNDKGRVTDSAGKAMTGLYVSGWIKRGPTGVIGTNKPDALETVESMLADAEAGLLFAPAHSTAEAARSMIANHKPNYVSYEDWQQIDRLERERGASEGRPRVKFTSASEALNAIGKSASGRP